jgi:hypothetical protein
MADSYLITKDYQRIIQTTELDDITESDVSIRKLVEGAVLTEIASYLNLRYDMTQEFQATSKFLMATIYKPSQRVYLDADAYSITATYAVGALTLQGGNVYNCITDILVGEAFTIAKWHLLGAQYDLFFITYPKALFDQDKFYRKDDEIYWNGKTYTARRDSIVPTHEQTLQALDYMNLPTGNVFPDAIDTVAAVNMWGVGVTYTVAAGTLPTDTTKWTSGDNRNQEMVEMYMDMVVYKLCKRIAPQNVPEVRHNAWLTAINKLKDFAKGNMDAQLPLLQPSEKAGGAVIFGGTVKQQNNW